MKHALLFISCGHEEDCSRPTILASEMEERAEEKMAQNGNFYARSDSLAALARVHERTGKGLTCSELVPCYDLFLPEASVNDVGNIPARLPTRGGSSQAIVQLKSASKQLSSWNFSKFKEGIFYSTSVKFPLFPKVGKGRGNPS